ncbi:MAG TPA: endonuclease [Mycobacteriales bacterium]|nr:endonuclease [Mycobacteriales bacterium]
MRVLLARHGQSYAEQAGIRLADRPSPLYQLLVLATLLSARISADVAVAAAGELFAAGYRTSPATRAASWQDRVDTLGRGHYRRYDERTATMLGDAAEMMLDRWRDDLRRLRADAGGDAGRIRARLMEFPGIGPAGADIYLREVQAVWPQVAPYLDDRVRDVAARLDLPTEPAELADVTGSTQEFTRLAAALVRVSRGSGTIDEVLAAAGT